MAINKVIYGQNTLIDLTNDTVTSNKMLSNATAHDKSGSAIVGSIPSKSAQSYTPTTSNQTITASQYLAGAQTILGDANLVASNIKDGVSIFGVNGTYSGSVDTANMYAGSTTPSAANIDDLWVDTSDEGGLPDVILPGSTPVKMSGSLGGGTNSTTDKAIGSSLTILKAGTYRIRCSMFRSSNTASATFKLYLTKNGTRISNETPTWDSTTRRTAEIKQDVACAAGDVLQMRGSISSSSYWVFCSPIIACIDWNLGV